MQSLKISSRILIIIGALLSTIIFGVLIIVAKDATDEGVKVPGTIIFADLVNVVRAIGGDNSSAVTKMLANQTAVGGVLIAITFGIALLYLIPVLIPQNNGFKIFGHFLAFIVGLGSLVLTIVAIYLATVTPTTIDQKYRYGLKFQPLEILFLIGPFLLTIGAIIGLKYSFAAMNNSQLSEADRNRQRAINLTAGRIGARGTVPQKQFVQENEIKPRAVPPVNQAPSVNNDLKLKMAQLKQRMASAQKIANENSINNSRWVSATRKSEPKEEIRVGAEGQYLRTLRDGEVLDESPKGVDIANRAELVQKGDVIKHHESYHYQAPNQVNKSQPKTSLFIPKSKQSAQIDTRTLEQKVGGPYTKGTVGARPNPNAKVDHSYDGKVFLGDIDKIWKAGKKYREDITVKKPQHNEFNNQNPPANNYPPRNNNDEHNN
ncbi:hypothetical protein [Spiroplasma sp. DGKH1]|uniref:hypothetical protein n=1 Tax=Spiroplasma sp. DGKH1 TaxID=3050074 RepID=UPI0034C6B2A4